jgi:hypothetical protein
MLYLSIKKLKKKDMIHSIYTCDDYGFDYKDNILTIWNAKEVAKVKDLDGFYSVSRNINYSAIICPGLYTDMDGSVLNIDIILFK